MQRGQKSEAQEMESKKSDRKKGDFRAAQNERSTDASNRKRRRAAT